MSDWADNMERWWIAKAYDLRTIVPGLVDAVEPNSPDREQVIDFRLGIADLAAGEPEDLGIAPTIPMLSIGSGGFGMLMPAGGETVVLVGDRASGPWRANKTPGVADRVNGKRSKVLADGYATPFQFTASEGAPVSWDGQVLYGPAGVAILIEADGTVTITGRAPGPPAPPATSTTIVMQPGGDINLTVGLGNSVNVGGPAALALAKAQAVETALIAATNAAIAAALPIIPPLGDGGTLGFTAFLGGLAGFALAVGTTKAKGE